MAQIVNDVSTPTPEEQPKKEQPVSTEPVETTPPTETLDKESIQALRRRKRKSIYDHVSFRSLYEYSDTVESIREKSKLALTKHIEAHKAYWQALRTRVGSFHNLDVNHPLFTNNGAIPYAKEICGYGVYTVPIGATERRETETDDTTEYSIASSLIHICDPFNGITTSEADCLKVADALREYLDLGIFPTVAMPIDFSNQISIAEKYEHVKHQDDIGIIIDIQTERVGKEEMELIATVLWNPTYTANYQATMYGCFSGCIKMVDVVEMPKPWSAINDISNIFSAGVPVFELEPNTMVLGMISANHELRDLIDSALTSGQVMFGFVEHLIAQMHGMSQRIMEAANPETKQPTPQDGTPAPTNHMPVEVGPVETPAYEGPSDVPVEDASEVDDIGRRMRLYDGDADDCGPEPIYNAFRVDDDEL